MFTKKLRSFAPLKITLLFAILGLCLALTSNAQAAGVVSSCTEAGFNTALVGGGDIIFACDGTITITSVKFISSNTTIDATGRNVVLDGGSSQSIFNVSSGVSLTLKNLTIQNAAGGTGSVISMYNGGTLIIEDSRFLYNQSSSHGGAIAADVPADINGDPAIVQIRRSIFDNNQAGGNGGAIFIDGGESGINVGARIEIEDSTFRNNTSLGDGGAILANFHVTLNSEGSLYTNNIAQGDGGAIRFGSTDGIANLANNTFSGNAANQDGSGGAGGALFLMNSNLVHNTFYNNDIGLTGTNRNGSAIYWAPIALSVIVRDNIFRSNTGSTYECMRGNTYAPYGSNNLTDDGSCNGGTTAIAVTNFDTNLLDHGGPTLTHVLLANSNAIDSSSNCTYASSGTNNIFTNGDNISRDQRGAARAYGLGCDKGSYEVREVLSVGNCTGSELAGSHDFEFSSGLTVTVGINSANGLNCVQIEEMGREHPLGNPGMKMTNNWWHITGNIDTGFDVNLTLPASFVPDTGDLVCRYAGVAEEPWDCAADSFNGVSITRNNVTEFSDWATFEDQSPTAVSLLSFQEKSSLSINLLISVIGLILISSLVILHQKFHKWPQV